MTWAVRASNQFDKKGATEKDETAEFAENAEEEKPYAGQPRPHPLRLFCVLCGSLFWSLQIVERDGFTGFSG